MKHPLKQTLFLILTTAMLIACGQDDGPTAKEEFINSIAGTWTVDESSTIILDDEDITSLLLGFELSINTDLTYRTNSDQLALEVMPWPTAGSFEINDDLTQFTRDDGLVITTSLEDSDNLHFTFLFSGAFDHSDGGRNEAINGDWRFILKRQ
jgi:hypothetical protein